MNLVKILLLLVAATLFLAHWNYERTPDDPILDMGDFFLRYSAKNATILVRVAKVEAFARTDKLALKLLSPQIKKIKNLVGESDELITEGEKILDAIELAQKKEDYKTAAKESFEIEKKIRGIKEKNLKANELYE
jgi:hypothetical protein